MQQSSVEEVIVHFREFLPANSSAFNVLVPRRFLNGRKFRFECLSLYPDLFGKEAAGFEIEAQEEELVYYRTNLRVEMKFVGDKKNFFPSKFTLGKLTNARDFVQEFNNFFEQERPAFMKRCPVFFDWTDNRVEADSDHMKDVSMFEDVWFNESFNLEKHGGGLPDSLADLPGANQLKFPAEGFTDKDQTIENFRVRLFLAPYTTVSFSNFGILQDLGFAPEQFGEQTTKVKCSLINQTAHYTEITAFSAPVLKLTASACTVSLIPSDPLAQSYTRTFEISALNYKKHEVIAKMLNDKILDCADQINIKLSLEYDKNEKKFKFHFPSSTAISVAVIFQRPELPARLGYFYSNVISSTDEPKEIVDLVPAAVDDSYKRRVSLCYDTGIVVCTMDQASSNAASGALDLYMASLLPAEPGIMEMDKSCYEMHPGVFLASPSGFTTLEVPFTFQLLRIYDNQEMRKFAWKDGAYVVGILRGIPVVDGAPRRHVPSARHESLV